jgi:mxaK protein
MIRWMLGAVALPVAIVAALLWTAVAGWSLYQRQDERRIVAELARGRNVTPPEGASAQALFARGHFMLTRDLIDEGQGFARLIADEGDPALAARFLYDLGNARLRRAIASLEASKIDPAIPEVRLAKEAYKSALAADPELWDARYNLDVAMRLVRDFPELEREGEETKAQPKKLWTDLPGLPRGLP